MDICRFTEIVNRNGDSVSHNMSCIKVYFNSPWLMMYFDYSGILDEETVELYGRLNSITKFLDKLVVFGWGESELKEKYVNPIIYSRADVEKILVELKNNLDNAK